MSAEHPGVDNITQAIKDNMAKHDCNNVSIYMPGLDDDLMVELRRRFKKVDKQPFGYMRFES